jgi:hypothetical protein
MTLREALGPSGVEALHERIDEVLDADDALVVLIDGSRATSHLQGFGLSGAQLEMLSLAIERTIGGSAASRGTDHERRGADDTEGRVVDFGRRRRPDGVSGRGRHCGTRRDDDDWSGRRRIRAGGLFRMANAPSPPDDGA